MDAKTKQPLTDFEKSILGSLMGSVDPMNKTEIADDLDLRHHGKITSTLVHLFSLGFVVRKQHNKWQVSANLVYDSKSDQYSVSNKKPQAKKKESAVLVKSSPAIGHESIDRELEELKDKLCVDPGAQFSNLELKCKVLLKLAALMDESIAGVLTELAQELEDYEKGF